METSVIALSVATLVVLILLMSCWGVKPSSNKPRGRKVVFMRRSNKGSNNRGSRRQMPRYQASISCPVNEKSNSGQGLKNRQLAGQYNDLVSMQGYDDYNSVMQYASLEPEVFDSHNSYSSNVGIANSGASSLSVRSDPNDVNPWVGLRRPDYHSVHSGCDVRVDHSEIPDQMFASTHYLL